VATDYDLIVIGGGAAGLAVARTAVARGARTALVTDGDIGGECTLTGCVPSKTLIESAARGASFGEATTAVHSAVMAIAATETAEVLRQEGIDVIGGHALFRSNGAILAGDRLLRARRFVIATGSRPALPPVPGLADVPCLTNESVFNLTAVPGRLAVLGGGPVGCELGQAFARLGSEVTLIEAADRLLPAADPEVSEVITEALGADGVSVRTGSAVTTAAPADGDNPAALILADGEKIPADQVLVAAGRVPVTDGMDLDRAGVQVDQRGQIVTDRHLATTRPGIYAAGDVTGLMPFTHAAFAMGRIAARNALRRPWVPPAAFATGAIPWVVFTDPEVAQVGLTQQQAAARHARARVAYLPMTEVDRAITAGRTAGFVKIIAGPRPVLGEAGGGKLLGATIVAARAGEMISELAVAIRSGLFTGRLAQTVHAYPTWSLAVQQAAAQFFGEFGGRAAGPARPVEGR
jgi:pyruvate/2-oxoglutarate dehydrogenase complex dihydrolipoamide dehydrogenase (E3) component